ncbi:MAG: metal-sensing transcriptional repressor [Anaerolineae bacterium]
MMTVDCRMEQRLIGVTSNDVHHQVLSDLEQVEARIRHIQQLVLEDAPCCEVLRESAAVQDVMARLERALLLSELRECLLQIRHCTPEVSPALLDELLEIFSAVATLPALRRVEEIRQ